MGVIALTLLDIAAYRQAVLAAGADDLVRKAELTTDLLPAIRRVMQANRSRKGRTDAIVHPSPRRATPVAQYRRLEKALGRE